MGQARPADGFYLLINHGFRRNTARLALDFVTELAPDSRCKTVDKLCHRRHFAERDGIGTLIVCGHIPLVPCISDCGGAGALHRGKRGAALDSDRHEQGKVGRILNAVKEVQDNGAA